MPAMLGVGLLMPFFCGFTSRFTSEPVVLSTGILAIDSLFRLYCAVWMERLVGGTLRGRP